MLQLLLLFVMVRADAAADDFAAALAEGDAHYARRAEGATGATALPAAADASMVAYRRALALDPQSNAARWRLIRSLFFRANFCGTQAERRKPLVEEARRVGDAGIAPLEARVGSRKGKARIAALAPVPDVALLYFWAAVAWGDWAQTRSKLAAARAGAAGRIRDLGQIVLDLDPGLEQGGGDRILGRLHDQAPHILFLTGWISREAALNHLRRALEHGPKNTVNMVFLAEAILDHDPGRKAEARRLLETCAAAPPRPAYLVEDAYYADLSRQRLAKLR